MRDRVTGTVTRITEGTESLDRAWISADSSTLASFASHPTMTGGFLFVHDTASRRTTLLGPFGANVGSDINASLSDDGNLFSFDALADPMTGQKVDRGVYVLDRRAMKVTRISGTIGEGDPYSSGGYLSGDGRLVAFAASIDNRLQPRVLDRQTGSVTKLPVPGPAFVSDLSRDGKFIAIRTNSGTLAGTGSGDVTNLYVAPTGR